MTPPACLLCRMQDGYPPRGGRRSFLGYFDFLDLIGAGRRGRRESDTDPARPLFGRRFRGAGSLASSSLGPSLRPADPERPIPVSTEAGAGRADTSWSWPMGGGFSACRAFGAAGGY